MKNLLYKLLFVPLALFGQADNLFNLSDSLVAKYTFNGNVLDVSGNGNHATINTAELTTDRFGNLGAYEFNNSNIEIDIPFYDNSWNDYTFSFWFLTDNINKRFQTIFNTIPHDGEGVSFNHPNASDQLSHWKTQTVNVHEWSTFDGTGNPFFNDIQENQWYFVVVIKEGIDYKYYINGNLTQISTPEEENNTGLTGIRFGNIGSGEYLSGKIDDFSLWNRSLNHSEILELYYAEEDCVEETIVGEYYYYDNDSATSDYCNDTSNFIYDNQSNELIWHFDQNGTIDDNLNNPLSYIRCNDSIHISGAQNTDLTILDNGWLVGCANGSIPVVLIEAGCTNEIALNYNENAYIENNTCEFYSGPDWYVSIEGINEIGFGDEEHPFASIQYAIDASNHGDIIYVQSGTYYENLNLNGKNITLIGEDKLTTIIDAGAADSRIVTFNSGENATCVLSGFTLSNSQYGAISVEGSSPTLENLIIKGNSANDGGGIYVYDSQELTINNCELIENSSSGHGGALSIWYQSNVSINNSTFTSNESQTGGGVYSFNSSLDINYSIFNSNLAVGDGGGITISSTSNSQLDMANATMYDNSATTAPESNGIRLAGSGSSANITNSIIWENISGDNFSINYSNIQGQGDDNFEIYPGEGNIAQIPLFNSVDSSNPDYHLTVCSPCIDAGNPEETDPDGSIIDMGALPFITQGYDCEGNITAEIGDIIEGGYLFYLDESGQHGLVAALDDIEGTYEWGCFGTSILGADGQSIGTGYQNTLDIESVCSETPIAASEALAYESEGYIDWYLPSIDELSNIYSALNTLSNYNGYYWSSSEASIFNAWSINFDDGFIFDYALKSDNVTKVIPIRAFGNWTMGCMNETAYNYSEDADMDDGSCYPVIEGCMDTTAFNYTQTTDDIQIDVNTDDGSCYPVIEGCLDTESFNFNDIDGDGYKNALTGINGIDINTDDGSCYPVIEGCMNPIAENYIPQIGDVQLDVNTEDGSCLFSAQVYDDITTTNSNLEEELSVFETVEEGQDYSMSFDGVDDWVEASSISIYDTITNSLTISSWVKLDEDFNDYGTIIARRNFVGNPNGERHHFELTVLPTGGILFSTANNENNDLYTAQLETESELLNRNQWYYLSLTFENGIVSLYVNGELILANDFGYKEMFPNNHWINFGRIRRSGGQQFFNEFNGQISKVELWDSVLSQDDILSFMNCPPTGQEDGLVGYWNFNEGSGDTVYDLSDNGNHGYINGAIFSEDVPESYNGCTDANALNFDESALCDNGCCVFADDVLSNLEESYNQTVSGLNNELDSTNSTLNDIIDTWQSSIDLTNATLEEVSQMNQTIASFTTLIDLQEGWNMIGYGCPEPVNIEQGMSMYTDLVLLIKDNNGSVYLPEFNFNGIGDFTPGYGYQLKVSEPIEDFGLCGDYTTTESPEITDIETDNAQMQNDINCLTGNPEIGDYCYGGIVFYVDEVREGGLISLSQNIGLMSWDDGLSHSENLMIHGYDDWFLPSIYQLEILYNNIGPSSNFEFSFAGNNHWSSSLEDSNALAFNFVSGSIEIILDNENNTIPRNILPIRQFGELEYGCTDSSACNYNSEANMADGSCDHAELGYDCEGNITAEIGDIMEGGYLFYIDESGTRGLVAAMESLPQSYMWGCMHDSLNGVNHGLVTNIDSIPSQPWIENSYEENSNEIGSGIINTINILNSDCNNDFITAAEAVSNFIYQSYDDWYLASQYELIQMYNKIGPSSSLGNIGQFSQSNYLLWSSTQVNDDRSIAIYFDSLGENRTHGKLDFANVRPIRAFGNWTMGCMDSHACNFNPEANMANGSCEYADLGYDCEGNITEYVVGMEAEGGIVFYVDESGQHGLVAAMEDLTEGATDPYEYGFNGYEWGCYQQNIDGAYGTSIGTGYQNTMDIVNHVCSTENGGITAAQAALDADINGYSDWYLPSLDELKEIYNTIGDVGPEGNIGGLQSDFYLSSSESINGYGAQAVDFYDGHSGLYSKSNTYRVRVIRAF